MQVKSIMSKKMMKANADMKMMDMWKMMDKNNMDAMPVVEGKQLVGMVSVTDIFDSMVMNHEMEKTARQIMTKKILTCSENDSLEKIARKMFNNDINGMPVMNDKGEMVGFIARSDLIELMGKRKTH